MKKRKIERLDSKDEKDTIKRIFLLSAISIILAIFLFTFGIAILGRMADFLELIFQKNNPNSNLEDTELRVPVLDKLLSATNSAQLAISGFAGNDVIINIYLNDNKIGETKVEDNKFTYDSILLSNGNNRIKVKAISENRESVFSEENKIILDTEEPDLEIISPEENKSFKGDNRITVKGITEPDSQVFANGFLTKLSAPRFMASIVTSTVPSPVTITDAESG